MNSLDRRLGLSPSRRAAPTRARCARYGALAVSPDPIRAAGALDFPSPEMKTIGFVTRTLIDEASGQELAVVYVPTTPIPTSGYIEIVPVTKVISTDWTLDEAMQFLMTAGTAAPDTFAFTKNVDARDKPVSVPE